MNDLRDRACRRGFGWFVGKNPGGARVLRKLLLSPVLVTSLKNAIR